MLHVTYKSNKLLYKLYALVTEIFMDSTKQTDD